VHHPDNPPSNSDYPFRAEYHNLFLSLKWEVENPTDEQGSLNMENAKKVKK